MRYLAGIDIGGTKCAVTLGAETPPDQIRILDKIKFPTPGQPEQATGQLTDALGALLERHPEAAIEAVGVSCGGPLDSGRGLILSPPNLPGWDRIDVLSPFRERFHVPAALQNDANACALAEWRWGAGRGTQNMIFLTFGTGLGAGLILGGRLYAGTNDMAGEVGHVRLAQSGPWGYGKEGSFEGFCSGGGIARHAASLLRESGNQGKFPAKSSAGDLSAADIAKAADAGDKLALEIMEHTGRMLGRGLAMLIDILNPERIVIGSIFLRQEKLLRGPMEEEIRKEALEINRSCCRIVPAGLGEQLGDYAALSVAGSTGGLA